MKGPLPVVNTMLAVTAIFVACVGALGLYVGVGALLHMLFLGDFNIAHVLSWAIVLGWPLMIGFFVVAVLASIWIVAVIAAILFVVVVDWVWR